MSTTDKLDIGGWEAVLKDILKEVQLDDKDITTAAQWLLNRKFFTKSSLNTRTWRSQAVDDFAVIVSDGGIAAINTYFDSDKTEVDISFEDKRVLRNLERSLERLQNRNHSLQQKLYHKDKSAVEQGITALNM